MALPRRCPIKGHPQQVDDEGAVVVSPPDILMAPLLHALLLHCNLPHETHSSVGDMHNALSVRGKERRSSHKGKYKV